MAAAVATRCVLWPFPSSPAMPFVPTASNSHYFWRPRAACPSLLHLSLCSRKFLSSDSGMPLHCLQRCSRLEDRVFNGSVRRRNGVVCEVVVEISGSPPKEGEQSLEPEVGSKVRVTTPLTVYHIPRIPEFDLKGRDGEIKQVLTTWKGKPISANLPYKVQFEVDVDNRHVKFIAHLKKGEFEVLS